MKITKYASVLFTFNEFMAGSYIHCRLYC